MGVEACCGEPSHGRDVATSGFIHEGDGQSNYPTGVAVDPTTGDVYVADGGNDRVQKFDSDGTFLTAWGTQGTGNGQFNNLTGVAVDPTTGNVYVTDLNDRVEVFDSDGTFLTAWGSRGTGNGQFNGPSGVAVDPTTGNVYVADDQNRRVQMFDSDGTFLTKRGVPGVSGGPLRVAVDPTTGDVYVTDTDNNRVQKFGYQGRPDGRIRRGTGVLVGNNIYNTTGIGQTSNGTAARGQRVTYLASIQNDARFAERLRLRGQASTPNFTVRYYNPTGANITPQVNAGVFRTPVLAPEATYRVAVVVTVLRAAPRNAWVARTLTATSTTYPTLKDTVRFITSRS